MTFNTTIEIVESGKKVDYLFKGYIEKYDGENLVWRHQMPLENDWSGGALDTYGEVFVVKSDKELHIKDLVTGDTVWSMNRNEAEHELKSFNSIFVYQGLLILPFASEQGMYRRSLSLN